MSNLVNKSTGIHNLVFTYTYGILGHACAGGIQLCCASLRSNLLLVVCHSMRHNLTTWNGCTLKFMPRGLHQATQEPDGVAHVHENK
eukprot:3031075-Amphidinium_carterae.1